MKYATSGYFYRSGQYEYGKAITKASTGIAVADGLKQTSAQLDVLTTGVKAQGIALEAKAVGDAATTAIKYLKALPGRMKVVGTTKTNSLAAADLLQETPLSGTTGAMGIDATPAAGDFFIQEIISTGSAGQAVLYFIDPATLSSL